MKEKIIVFLAFIIVSLLRLTCRFRLHFASPQAEEFFTHSLLHNVRNLLIGFFHQDELCLLPFFKGKKLATLVSLSKDGNIMTGLAMKLGFQVVRGSSSRGAARALIGAIKTVQQGYNFAIAVDGPRGPIYKAKPGLSTISKKTNVPIMPLRAIPTRSITFKKSWNQARLPLPFSTIHLYFGNVGVYTAEQLEQQLGDLGKML